MADRAIWTYAKENGFDIITADGDDYPPLAKRLSSPPRVILLESWRYPTRIALQVIRGKAILISEFAKSDQALLILRVWLDPVTSNRPHGVGHENKSISTNVTGCKSGNCVRCAF